MTIRTLIAAALAAACLAGAASACGAAKTGQQAEAAPILPPNQTGSSS